MTAIVAAVGWLSGLAAATALPPLDLTAAALLLAAAAGLGGLGRARPAATLAAVAVAGALLAVLRAQAAAPPTGPGSVLDYADMELELRGRVVAEPEPVDRGTRLRVAVAELHSPALAATTFGDVRAVAPGRDWRYGDEVALRGRLERPIDRDDVPLAEVFARQGVLASVRADEARLLARAPPLAAPAREAQTPGLAARLDRARAALYDVKAAASAALDRSLPAPTAALARGLLLGGTSGMPPDLVEAFRRAGLTHVVAVSGYNITLVAAALSPLASRAASRLVGFALPAGAVLAFTLAVGAPASAVRAALMGGLVLLARQAGRPPDAVAALSVAALLMTAVDPGLIDDLGFLLSSLATLAIVAVFPWLNAHLPGPRAAAPGALVRAAGGVAGAGAPAPDGAAGPGLAVGLVASVRETVLATLAVELLTLPLIAATFGRVSTVSPLANLLVLPAVPLAMATSLPVALGGGLPEWSVAPLAWAAWVPLAWIVAAVEAAAAPAWASLPVGRLPTALVWAYYAAAAVLLTSAHAASYRLALPSPAALAGAALAGLPTGVALTVALVAAVVAWAAALGLPDRVPRLTLFEASGAALLQTASGRSVLIDPGPGGRALAADLGRTLPFYAATLDLVVVPRGPAEALPDLLRRYRVGQIVAPEAAEEPSGARWRDAAAAAGQSVASPPDGTSIPIGDDARLDLLRAAAPRPSYALHLVVGHRRVLLIGDGSASAQRALAERVDGLVDVVRLPADGAGLEPSLRARLAPRLAVVAARPGAPPAAPRADERLQVLRADDHGTIVLTFRPGGLEVRARR